MMTTRDPREDVAGVGAPAGRWAVVPTARVVPILLVLAAMVVSIGSCSVDEYARFSPAVATSLASNQMDRLETPDLLVYFPRQRREEAVRFVARTENCVALLRARQQIHNGVADAKLRVVLPDLPYNNADVNIHVPGLEVVALVATYATVGVALEMGGPLDPAMTACHELTHYVQNEQMGGFWGGVDALGLAITPQLGLDAWFWEGLATYYETSMLPGTGRLSWPFFLGSFAAGVAGRRLNGGDLNRFNRAADQGNEYLMGSHFIRFLIEHYGEEKLWRFIALQGQSILFPLGVNVRFWQVYDKSLSTLIDEFADEVAARFPVRRRPAEQRSLMQLGRGARYARAANGTQAIVDQDFDISTRLRILDPSGRVLAARYLTEILPPRKLNGSNSLATSGLSFTADGSALYFVGLDQGLVYQRTRLLRYDVATGDVRLVASDIRGIGGSVSPDGRRYWFGRVDGDRHDLAEVDTTTGEIRVIAPMAAGSYIVQPRFSPDGKRVVASVFDGHRYELVLFDGQTGKKLRSLPAGPGPVIDVSFVDDERIVYLGPSVGANASPGFQVYLQELATGRIVPVTRAPYLAFQPQAAGGRSLRFLNREGWHWTLDEVDLPAPPPASAEAPPALAVAAETSPSSGEAVVEPLPSGSAPSLATTESAKVTEKAMGSAPRPTDSPVTPTILSERPYSPWSTLFIPKLIVPKFLIGIWDRGNRDQSWGATVVGYDRLQFHIWALQAMRQSVSGLMSYDVGYRNSQLAPFFVTLLASQSRTKSALPLLPGEVEPNDDDHYTLFRRDSAFVADVSREFFGNVASLGAELVESYRPGDPAITLPLTRVAGPYVDLSYIAADGTPYTGAYRALSLLGRAAYFPKTWSANDLHFADLSGRLMAVLPLPLFRRHSLTLSGKARALPGTSSDEPLLQVGGFNYASFLRVPKRDVPELSTPRLPDGVHFVEYLRGFEDYLLAANTAFIGHATYQYPFIIDRGSASTFGILPSFFVPEVDLELFGSAARTQLGPLSTNHAAVGGSLTLVTAVWITGVSLTYQGSRRLTDDRGWTHLVQIGY